MEWSDQSQVIVERTCCHSSRIGGCRVAIPMGQGIQDPGQRSGVGEYGQARWHSLVHPFAPSGTGGANAEIIDMLVERGARRTLQNARDELPVDVAKRNGKEDEIRQLNPWMEQEVPIGILKKIQSHFHAVIASRVNDVVNLQDLRLPELEPLPEMDAGQRFWFSVPGMYGGFQYFLAKEGVDAKLVSTSWCRVVESSTEVHEITSAGAKMMEQPPPGNWITFVDEK